MDYVGIDFVTKETFWNVTQCSMVNVHRRYGVTYWLHPKSRKYPLCSKEMENVSSARLQVETAGGVWTTDFTTPQSSLIVSYWSLNWLIESLSLEAVHSSEMSVTYYKTTRHQFTENGTPDNILPFRFLYILSHPKFDLQAHTKLA
jgi:hypothetical protein